MANHFRPLGAATCGADRIWLPGRRGPATVWRGDRSRTRPSSDGYGPRGFSCRASNLLASCWRGRRARLQAVLAAQAAGIGVLGSPISAAAAGLDESGRRVREVADARQ